MNVRSSGKQCAFALAGSLPLVVMLCAWPAAAEVPVRIAVDAGPVNVLRHLTHLLRPSTAPANRLCAAQAGDTGTVLETVATEASPVYWVRVRFDSGGCNGQEGWVSSAVMHVQ